MSNSQLIYDYAINAGIPTNLAALLVAQARHETGDFTSKFFQVYNNAFGYSYVPGGKWQNPVPGSIADNGKPIAAYTSLQNSVGEIADWLRRRVAEGKFPALVSISTPDQYAKLLKDAGYYGDTLSNYAAGLKRFYKSASEFVVDNTGLIVVSSFVLAGITYYIMQRK